MLCRFKHFHKQAGHKFNRGKECAYQYVKLSNLGVRKKKWLASIRTRNRPSAHFNQKPGTASPPRKCYRVSRSHPRNSFSTVHHDCIITRKRLLLVSAATRLSLFTCTCIEPLWSGLRHVLIARPRLYTACPSHLHHTGAFSANVWNPGANNIVAPNTFLPSLINCTAHRET